MNYRSNKLSPEYYIKNYKNNIKVLLSLLSIQISYLECFIEHIYSEVNLTEVNGA